VALKETFQAEQREDSVWGGGDVPPKRPAKSERTLGGEESPTKTAAIPEKGERTRAEALRGRLHLTGERE